MNTHFIFRISFSVSLVLLFCPSIYAGVIPPCSPTSSFASPTSFNLDFHNSFTGLPGSYGAASGQAGTWVNIPVGTTNELVDTSGTTTPVSITVTGLGDAYGSQTTTDGILLCDSIINDIDFFEPVAFSVSLANLPNGVYDIYYYSCRSVSGMTLNSQPMNDLSGGSADALEAQGTNWDVVSNVVIIDGTLNIIDTDVVDSEGLSGIQIVTSPFPTSFNLDFANYFTGLPESYGAASGQAGTWGNVPVGTTNELVDTSGTTTPVSITVTGLGDAYGSQTTTDSILLRDSIVNDIDIFEPVAFSASLTNLPNGVYDIYYYSCRSVSGMTLNSQPMNDLSGGSADALEAQGTNWDVVSNVVIIDGTLNIIDTDVVDSEGLSGIQIVTPCCDGQMLGDANLDCKINIIDLSYLAQHWLTCHLKPVEFCWQ